jgi:hypothetical protein
MSFIVCTLHQLLLGDEKCVHNFTLNETTWKTDVDDCIINGGKDCGGCGLISTG